MLNEILILSILIFLFMTYKFIKVFKTEKVPKGNKIIASSLYGVCIIGLVTINILF